jgi:citrate synthase
MTASTTGELHDGLEGVVAFVTEIAEPDRDGNALRYRGVDLQELVGIVPFEQVWGLLVDDRPQAPLPVAQPLEAPLRSGDVRVDLQAGLAALGPRLGLRPLIDTDPDTARDQLARLSAAALDLVADAARGADGAVPAARVAEGGSAAERFVARWRGEVDPDAAAAIDAYWVAAAEHGMNASTFTARVVASTGADVAAALSAAVGALSGPLHGGAPSRVLAMLDAVQARGDADAWVRDALDRGERLMGFGHRVYRAEDPRARVLRRAAQDLGAGRLEVALALEAAALRQLRERKPDRVLATNVEFWSAVVLDRAGVPQELFTPLFACARTAGWSAHVLEQRRRGRLIRPTAIYEGHGPRAFTGATVG